MDLTRHEYDPLTQFDTPSPNYIDKAQQLCLKVEDAEMLRNYFHEMQTKKQKSDFYYEIDVDYDLRLKNVFWVDNRCRIAYQSLGDVITFDTTYLTNAYTICGYEPSWTINLIRVRIDIK